MTKETVMKPIHAFAVPTLLMRSFALQPPTGSTVTTTKAEAIGFTIDVTVFSFRSARARNKAANEFLAQATQNGKQLETVACLANEVAMNLFIATPNAELWSPNEQPDHDFYLMFKDFVDADFAQFKIASRFFGIPLVFCYGQEIAQPPFPVTDDGRVHFFYCARPPGIKLEMNMPIEELFDLKIWQHGEKRSIHGPTPGRGRLIEQNGVCVFQVLGRTYYQICLIPVEEHHTINRPLIFAKLLEVLYHDLLESNSANPDWAEATSEQLAAFGEKQAGKHLANEREELRKTETAITKKEKELFELFGKRDQSMKTIRAISADPFTRELHERLPNECAQIKELPGVVSVHIVDDAIQIKTVPIVITHAGIRYDLGPFVIRLENDGKPTVWSENPKHPKGHHHPHIGRIHLACFGNITLAVAKYMATFRYADAARLVIRWLNTYNPDNTLTPIEEWASMEAKEVHHA